MTKATGERLDRARRLLMCAIDDELSARERRELDDLLESDPALRTEWEQLSQIKHATDSVKLRNPSDEVWEGYMNTVYRRFERSIGWILASVGAVVLVSYGIWTAISEVIADTTVPWFIKAGTLALVVGAVILFVSVVREKLFIRKTDPYKDVIR